MYLQKLKDTVTAIGANIEFTRLYQNLGVTVPRWQNVHEVFFHACTQLDIKRIRIQSDTGGLEIFADPLLERVFYNIIENAVEHGVRLSLIRLLARETADGMIITIEDDGVGVPNHEKEKIFEKGHGKNTGLGLFLSREILSITGISITESGEYQHGARFEMKVPNGMYRYSGADETNRCFILKKN
jgi:signal transduction histidine kinase